jgi:conserved hypothetical protein
LPSIGQIYDELKVTNIYHTKNKKAIRISGICTKCGRKKDMFFYSFRDHKDTMHKTCRKSRDKNKGLASTNKRLHRIWTGIRNRTTDPKTEHWEYYGGRGISSDAFALFVDFYDSMSESYQEAIEKYGDESVVSIDRIDVNADYTPENCRWISLEEQAQNKDRNKWFLAISPDGEKFFDCNKSRFSREHDIKRVTINNTLLYGSKNRAGWKFRYLSEKEICKYNLTDKLVSVKCNDYLLAD